MAIYSFDDTLEIYAYQENHLRIVATQGEGTDVATSQLSANDLLKAPRFQLCDERGVLSIPTSGNPRVQLAVKKQNGAEDLLDCVVTDATNGIVVCPIRKSLTDIPGDVEGEIRLITANSVIKFTGVNFFIYDGISDNAAEQSSQFSDLILALQQVSAIITGGSSGTISLDNEIVHNGTKPVASGVIYDFIHNKYMEFKSCTDAEIDSANKQNCVYRHLVSGNNMGAVFFVDFNNYVDGVSVKQFRLRKNGRLEYRNGVTSGESQTGGDAYTWDKAYNENWYPIGMTENIQDLAITAAKIADSAVITAKIQDSAVTSPKIASGAVIEGKIADGAVTTNKIGNSSVTEGKIANGAVTTDKIGTKSVTSVKLADSSVTTDKIGAGEVKTDNIANSAVTNAKIANGAVSDSKISNGAIIEDKIGVGAVTTYKIKNAAVTEDKLASNSVTTDKIKDGEITPSKLDRTYERFVSCSNENIDTANNCNTVYIHTISGAFKGLVIFSDFNNYASSGVQVTQYRFCRNGRVEYRIGSTVYVSGQLNTYVWDKTYSEDWHPIISTQNLQDLAVTTAKIQDCGITADKLAVDSVTTAKIKDGEVTPAKLDRQYEKFVSCSNGEIDSANDANTIYLHNCSGGFKGIVFFIGYNNYTGSTTVKQFRLCKDGRFEYRTGTISTPISIPNTYIWDKSYDEDWNPIGSTANIQDSAVTTAKIADESVTYAKLANLAVITSKIDTAAVTQEKLDTDSVGTSEIINGAVTTSKIADGAVTAAKLAETYVQTSRTIAGIDLVDNVTATELAHALSSSLVNNEGLLNHAQIIHVGKRNAPTSGGSTPEYNVNDIYINVLSGDLWICTSATLSTVWYYTWDLRGSIYNYPLIVSCEISSEDWNNNDYDLTSELSSIANGRNRIDVDFDNTVYDQLVIDGCFGLYATTDTVSNHTTFTLHAMNNAPTEDIIVQLTLSQAVISQ